MTVNKERLQFPDCENVSCCNAGLVHSWDFNFFLYSFEGWLEIRITAKISATEL